ncbi:hypothetical protein WI560_26175 [Bradyrhizobium sp. A11]|jgi:hypothetical protein
MRQRLALPSTAFTTDRGEYLKMDGWSDSGGDTFALEQIAKRSFKQ